MDAKRIEISNRIDLKTLIFGITFFLLNVLDAIQTRYAVSIGGKEGNPIALLFYHLDLYLFVKLVLALLISVLLIHYNKATMLIILTAAMATLIGWNIIALYSWI
jgi:positive regulator of sigma E activity